MRVHERVDLAEHALEVYAVDYAVVDDEVAAFVVDADVEISHAAIELLGKSEILRRAVIRHLDAPAVVGARDGNVRDGSVVVYVAHPFGEIHIGLHGVFHYDFVAHGDDGRKYDDQDRDEPEEATHRDECDLLFLLFCRFLLTFAAVFAASDALLFRRRVLSARELGDILHFPPRRIRASRAS